MLRRREMELTARHVRPGPVAQRRQPCPSQPSGDAAGTEDCMRANAVAVASACAARGIFGIGERHRQIKVRRPLTCSSSALVPSDDRWWNPRTRYVGESVSEQASARELSDEEVDVWAFSLIVIGVVAVAAAIPGRLPPDRRSVTSNPPASPAAPPAEEVERKGRRHPVRTLRRATWGPSARRAQRRPRGRSSR